MKELIPLLMLAALVGCVSTTATYETPAGTRASFSRRALSYSATAGDIKVPGLVEVSTYQGDPRIRELTDMFRLGATISQSLRPTPRDDAYLEIGSVIRSPSTSAPSGPPDASTSPYPLGTTPGYTAAPDANGYGVYGSPDCGRTRTYKKNHPDTEMIDLRVPEHHAAMWAALMAHGRARNAGADYPIEVTADGYVMRAR